VLDTWLTPLKSIRKQNQTELSDIKDNGDRAKRLAELNVEMGVGTLLSNYLVEEAIQERGLQVHGVLYDIGCGKIRDLGVGTRGAVKTKGLDGTEDKKEIVRGNHGMLVFGENEAAMTVR